MFLLNDFSRKNKKETINKSIDDINYISCNSGNLDNYEKMTKINFSDSTIYNDDRMKNDFKNLSLPFGFKVNAFKYIPEGWKPDGSNPVIALGKNKDLNLEKFKIISKEFLNFGAKLLGGCCEISPSHISKLQDLR